MDHDDSSNTLDFSSSALSTEADDAACLHQQRDESASNAEFLGSLPTLDNNLLSEPPEVISLPTSYWMEIFIPGTLGPRHTVTFAEYELEDGIPKTFLKSVSVNFLDSMVTKYMRGSLCQMENSGKENPVAFQSISHLNIILKDFDEEKSCLFIRNEKYKDIGHVPSGSCFDGVWKANE